MSYFSQESATNMGENSAGNREATQSPSVPINNGLLMIRDQQAVVNHSQQFPHSTYPSSIPIMMVHHSWLVRPSPLFDHPSHLGSQFPEYPSVTNGSFPPLHPLSIATESHVMGSSQAITPHTFRFQGQQPIPADFHMGWNPAISALYPLAPVPNSATPDVPMDPSTSAYGVFEKARECEDLDYPTTMPVLTPNTVSEALDELEPSSTMKTKRARKNITKNEKKSLMTFVYESDYDISVKEAVKKIRERQMAAGRVPTPEKQVANAIRTTKSRMKTQRKLF